MKKLLFTAVVVFGCLSFKAAHAQVSISAGINIGSQPDWGPVGYDNAQYYYMPDIDAYYDVPRHQYVYNENNVWIHAGVLPARFHFDRYHSYKVVVNQRNPWEHHADIRARYAGFRGRHDQGLIRDSRDAHYQNHWRGGEGHRDNGRGQGGRDRGDYGRGQGGDRGRGNGGDRGRGNGGGDRGHGGGGDRGHGGGGGHGDKGHGDGGH
jgi:hypothetical protein